LTFNIIDKKSNYFINKFDEMSIMLSAEIRALNALSSSPADMKTLAKQIRCSYTRTTEIVKTLKKKRLVEREDGAVRLAETLPASLFKKLASKYDMEKLLGGKGEEISIALLSNSDTRGLQNQTDLSYRTIRRALTRIMETGAVRQSKKSLQLTDDKDLHLFLTSLRDLRTTQTIEPYAEAIPSPHGTLFKRVPSGKTASGFPTAFSAFTEYGVELRTTHDYYIQQRQKPSMEEVLIHALAASTDPVEVTDCAVFLAKNLTRIDLRKARRKAREFGVEQIFLDLENYIRNLALSSSEKFLPWEEFAQKAQLYDVNPESLLPKKAYPDFFNLLSTRLEVPLEVYLFGGEAMRIKELKRSTKDVDIAVADDHVYQSLRKALTSLGYHELSAEEIAPVDRRLNPSGIFVNENYPRVDAFTYAICGKFMLTKEMFARAKVIKFGNLILGVASNEDLLLLKSVTEREGDIQDMLTLARTPGFEWSVILGELLNQEEITGKRFCMDVLDSIEVVEERSGIKAPIHSRLERHCLDQAIIGLVERTSPITLKQIQEYIEYPEYRIASRLKALIKENKVKSLNEKTFEVVRT